MTFEETYDVLVIGGGPAGLSAALNLARSRARVLVIDADRPRNAATMNSHGFLTRDGIPPHELRRIARDELAAYPDVEIRTRVRVLELTRAPGSARDAPEFHAAIGRKQEETRVRAGSVLIATGLRETLPEVPGLLGFYGMSLFSCAACDAWELRDRRLGLFGATADLADRARLIARWTPDLTVFTHGLDLVSETEVAALGELGVTVVREPVEQLVGERGVLEGARTADGSFVPLDGGFVRPQWTADLSFLTGIEPERDSDGHLIGDGHGRTSVAGLYAAGDVASPGPQQLIVAAGAGARAAAMIVHDAVGVRTSH